MKSIYILFLSIFAVTTFAQYDIDIKLKNYPNDTLIVGNYYADKQLVKDTLLAKKKGKFEFEGKDTLKTGIYFLLTKPDNDYVQFFINGKDSEFEIEWDLEKPDEQTFKGSKDNEVFMDYVTFLSKQRPIADEMRARIAAADSTGVKDKEAEDKLAEVDESVQQMQEKLISENPDFISSKYLKSSLQVDLPEFEGEDAQLKKYRFYKEHYFDNVDLSDPAMLRTPVLHQRVNYYIEKLTPQDPDSIITTVDYLLTEMKPADETFKYYLSTLLNKYAKMKIVGYDKIYVHIVQNYYARGMADWVSEESLQKMKENANNLSSVLIGKKFPDITTYKEDGTPVRILDVASPYTVVLFWAHDCGHCTKSMPDVVKFYDAFENRGVTLVSICTKGGKKTKPCQEAVSEKKMDKFINTFDEYQRYRKLAYIPSTPKIFILDSEKEILIKDIGAKDLGGIMEQIMAMDAEKKAIMKGE